MCAWETVNVDIDQKWIDKKKQPLSFSTARDHDAEKDWYFYCAWENETENSNEPDDEYPYMYTRTFGPLVWERVRNWWVEPLVNTVVTNINAPFVVECIPFENRGQ